MKKKSREQWRLLIRKRCLPELKRNPSIDGEPEVRSMNREYQDN
jgi:hypothetical protein